MTVKMVMERNYSFTGEAGDGARWWNLNNLFVGAKHDMI
jgi:hypothetical protein